MGASASGNCTSGNCTVCDGGQTGRADRRMGRKKRANDSTQKKRGAQAQPTCPEAQLNDDAHPSFDMSEGIIRLLAEQYLYATPRAVGYLCAANKRLWSTIMSDTPLDLSPVALDGTPATMLRYLARRYCVTGLSLLSANSSALTAAACCPSLAYLDLSGCRGVTSVSALKTCTALRVLLLCACRGVSDLSPLSGCVSLEHLNLTGCRTLRSIAALKCSPGLTELNLNGCTAITDISVLAHCTALRVLNLSQSGVIDVAILAACASLKEVDLSGNRHIADISPLAHCDLHKLNLRDCVQLADVEALSVCTSLQQLSVSGCELTDLSPLATCHALQVLDASCCEYLTAVSGLEDCASLHTLVLNQCYSLTADVSVLFQSESLRQLYVSDTCSLRCSQDMVPHDKNIKIIDRAITPLASVDLNYYD